MTFIDAARNRLMGVAFAFCLTLPVLDSKAQPAFLTNSLVAHYQLNGNGSDVSGRLNNTRPIGIPRYSTNRFGIARGALDLKGSGGHLEADHKEFLNALPLTVSCWVASTNSVIPESGIITKYRAASWNGWALLYSGKGIEPPGSTGRLVPWYLRNRNDTIIGQYGFPPFESGGYGDGNWHHVTFVVDETFGRLYVDGELKSYQPWNGLQGACSSTEPLRIGFYPEVSGFDGLIDDVRIYNRALSDAELRFLYTYESKPSDPIQPIAPQPAVAVARIVDGSVVEIIVTDGGAGYTNAPPILFEGGGGSGAAAIAVLEKGSISEINIMNPGVGYTSTPKVGFAGEIKCPLDIPLPQAGNIRFNGGNIVYDIINADSFPHAVFGKLETPLTNGCVESRTNRFEIRTAYGSVSNLNSESWHCKAINSSSAFRDIPVNISSPIEAISPMLIDRMCGEIRRGPPVRLDWGVSVVEFETNRLVVKETDGWVSIPVKRTTPPGTLPGVESLTLAVRTEGSAVLGADYVEPEPVQMAFGVSSRPLRLRVIDNMIPSGAKTLILRIDPGERRDVVAGVNNSITIEILDNDQATPVSYLLEAAPSSIVALSDGRVLVAGDFQFVGGKKRPYIARLNRDLSLDSTFNVPSYYDSNYVRQAVSLLDGSCVTIGSLPRLNKIMLDGSLNNEFGGSIISSEIISFNSSIGLILADGGGGGLSFGYFPIWDSRTRNLRRWRQDGSLDPEFAENVSTLPLRGGFLSGGRPFAVCHDGRLVSPALINSATDGRYGVAWMNSNGKLDPFWGLQSGFSNNINSLTVDRQGRVLLAGRFKQFKTNSAPGWVRLIDGGKFDSTFKPSVSGESNAVMEVIRDGRILALNSTRLLLFTSMGDLVSTLASNVTAFAVQPDDSVLVGSREAPHLWKVSLKDAIPGCVEFERGRLIVSESASNATLVVVRMGSTAARAQVGYRILEAPVSLGIPASSLVGSLEFNEGESDARIEIPLSGRRSLVEENRVFRVELVAAEGVELAIGREVAIVEVVDEDQGLISEVFASQKFEGYGIRGSLQSYKSFFPERRSQGVDRQVFFEWGESGPNGAPTEHFAIIWSGLIVPEVTGEYQFATFADNGTLMWLEDTVVLDNWGPLVGQWVPSANIKLTSGSPYRLCLHYQEGYVAAECRLAWKPPGASNWVTVPSSVLRPVDIVRRIPPSLRASQQDDQRFAFDVTGEPGRPVRLEVSTNGVLWEAMGEVNHSATLVTNRFVRNPSSKYTPIGGRVRAVSVDGLIADSEFQFPLAVSLSVSGNTNLVRGSTNSVSLSAFANGGSGQVIRWWRNGVPTTNGASGSRITISARDADAEGEYFASVEAGGIRVESRRLGIGFAQKPEVGAVDGITLQEGMPAVLQFPVAGSEPMRYIWSKDGSPVPAGTNAALSILNVTSDHAGSYSLVVTNNLGAAQSGDLVVKVVPQGSLVPSVRWSADQLTTEIPTNPGRYEWQQSSDLRTWIPVFQVNVMKSPFAFTSTVPIESGVQFYRLVPIQ